MPLGFHSKTQVRLRLNKHHQVKKSLKYSVLDGSAWAAMMGLTQNYMTPFALELKATTSQIGLLSSIPALLTAIAQLVSPNLLERAGTRKGLILPMVFLNALMFIPIMLVPFIFQGDQVWWLLAFITVSTVAGAVINPAWGSMMADLVPMRLRGRFFGNRGVITGFTMLVFSFVASGVLTLFKGTNVFYGFVVLFSAALGFRMLSYLFLSKQYEPARKISKNNSPGMLTLIKQTGSTNLGRFILYIALIDFCVAISGPFFSVYMLRDLHFSYLQFFLVTFASSVAMLACLNYWGKRADAAGNLKVIKITSMLMPIVPVLWLGSTNVIYLMAANVVSGFAWSGYGLSAVNFVYDASEPSIRHKQLAVFNAMDGFAICIGFLLGGFLADKLPVLLGYRLHSIFTLSGCLRAVVVIVLLRRITEVRHVPGIPAWDLLKLNVSKESTLNLFKKPFWKARKSPEEPTE